MLRFKLLPAASVTAVIAFGLILHANLDRSAAVPVEPPIPASVIAAPTTMPPLALDADATHTDKNLNVAATAIDRPIRWVPARGWVRDPLGNGLDRAKIELENRGFDGAKVVILSTITDAGGEFEIAGLAAGREYRLRVQPVGDYAAHSIESYIADASSEPLIIVLERVALVDVDGMIVDTNLAPVANFELSLRSLAAEYPDRVIRSDATGYFRLEGFPAGELRIASNGSDYYRIKGLELKPDQYESLTLAVDRGSYHLGGWVSDDNGLPLEEAQVTLKSAFAIDGYHSYSFRTAVTDASGGFEFAELGGHGSTLAVYAKGFNSHIRQHTFQSFSDTIEIRLKR